MDQPFVECVGVVIDGCQGGLALGGIEREAEGGALGLVERELADEGTRARELDQLARLVRVAVDGIAIGGQQVAAGGQDQADRTSEMARVLINEVPMPRSAWVARGVPDGEDGIIAGRGDIEDVVAGSKARPVGPTTSAAGSLRCRYPEAIWVIRWTAIPSPCLGTFRSIRVTVPLKTFETKTSARLP